MPTVFESHEFIQKRDKHTHIHTQNQWQYKMYCVLLSSITCLIKYLVNLKKEGLQNTAGDYDISI